MEGTILIKNIDISKIKYSEPKTLPSGGRTIYVNYAGQRPIFQLPWLSLPYGLNNSQELADKMAAKQPKDNKTDDKNGPKKPLGYDISVSFKGSDNNIKVQQALDKLKEIEQKIINDAFDNRIAWLQDDFDGLKPIVAKLFSPIVKYDKDKNTGKIAGKYPPTMKIKVPYSEETDEFKFDCEDKDGVEIDFKTIMNVLKGGRCLPVIQLTGIWFIGGKFGVSWKLMRGRFQPSIFNTPKIIEDSDDEPADNRAESPHTDDDFVADALAAGVNISCNITNNTAVNTAVSSSDEEKEDDNGDSDAESDADSDAPPPPPPPPPVVADKKKTKSKK